MNVSFTNQAALLPNYNSDTVDYIELTAISINNNAFVIEPFYAISGSDSRAFRMYRDKEYVPVHVKSEGGKAELVDSYLLVQKQARPDHERGVVAIEHPNVPGASAYRYEADKVSLFLLRIIGSERDLIFQDGAETNESEKCEPRIMGEVVAWLRLRA